MLKNFLNSSSLTIVALLGLPLMAATRSDATTIVRVTITNLAPAQGTVLTPFWVGFHDGNFDIFDINAPASPSLERLAEDGMTDGIANDFLNSGAGLVEGTITGAGLGAGTPPVIPPATSATQDFILDGILPSSRYFSYASMVVPSNDAFVANGSPFAFKIFDDNGQFIGADLIITGDLVWDAGTEVNDEIPANTALLGQQAPNTGDVENGVVALHPGFVAGGNILNAFAQADFKAEGYQVARIVVQQVAVPEPGSILSLLGLGGLIWGWSRLPQER